MAVSTSLKKGVILMKNKFFILLLELVRLGVVSSVTVSKNFVTIRIKK